MSEYGIKVSAPGKDVQSAADKDLILKSSINMLKVALQGSAKVFPAITGNDSDTNNDVLIYGAGGSSEEHAQSFIASGNQVASLQVKLFKSGTPTDNFTCSIYDAPGGTLLGSASIAASSVSSGAYNTFTFGSPINVSRGGTYYLDWSRSGTRDTSNFIAVYIATGGSNPYPDGALFTKNSGVWSNDNNPTSAARFLITFNNAGLIIAHNLGYVPNYLAFGEPASLQKDFLLITADRTNTPYQIWADSTNVYIQVSSTYGYGAFLLYYYIFIDPL